MKIGLKTGRMICLKTMMSFSVESSINQNLELCNLLEKQELDNEKGH